MAGRVDPPPGPTMASLVWVVRWDFSTTGGSNECKGNKSLKLARQITSTCKSPNESVGFFYSCGYGHVVRYPCLCISLLPLCFMAEFTLVFAKHFPLLISDRTVPEKPTTLTVAAPGHLPLGSALIQREGIACPFMIDSRTELEG